METGDKTDQFSRLYILYSESLQTAMSTDYRKLTVLHLLPSRAYIMYFSAWKISGSNFFSHMICVNLKNIFLSYIDKRHEMMSFQPVRSWSLNSLILKLLGVWDISHDGWKGKIIKQFAKHHHFAWIIGWFQGVWWEAGLQWNGFCSFSWFMFKHLLRGSQICHVAITAQNSSENLRIRPMGWNSTFLNLFSLSLPPIQITGYRGVVIGKRLERGSKRPYTTASGYKWIGNNWLF